MTTGIGPKTPRAQARLGRPALPLEARRTHPVAGMVTADEHARALTEAAARGLTLSAYIRDRLSPDATASPVEVTPADTNGPRTSRLKTLVTYGELLALLARADRAAVSVSDLIRHLTVGVPLPATAEDLATAC